MYIAFLCNNNTMVMNILFDLFIQICGYEVVEQVGVALDSSRFYQA